MLKTTAFGAATTPSAAEMLVSVIFVLSLSKFWCTEKQSVWLQNEQMKMVRAGGTRNEDVIVGHIS